MNAEFQRLARKDKKAFLGDQCKETGGNNRMEKTRDFFKKIRDTKGTFHAQIGSIKDRNGMDLTEAEDIKKRWQEYTEERVLFAMTLMIRNPKTATPTDNAVSGMLSMAISMKAMVRVVTAVTSEPMHWFMDIPRVSTSLVTRLIISPLEDWSK